MRRNKISLGTVWLPKLATIALILTSCITFAEDAAPRVRVVVDYGDGVEKHFTAISWREGMTVLDAMQAAQEHPRGLKFKFRGSGATAFLTQIDDLENQGRGGNWVYRVNGELAERSFGVYHLEAGDAVLWRFEKPR